MYLPVIVATLVSALGVVGIVLGEADDAPGLQLIGGVLVAAAAALAVRFVRRHGKTETGVPR